MLILVLEITSYDCWLLLLVMIEINTLTETNA